MDSPFNAYIKTIGSVPLFPDAEGTRASKKFLIWGDGVKFLTDQTSNGRRFVKARGTEGWVRESDLGDEPLLELYFIDVGQGDGVLIRTPDFRHILIDGGFPRSQQPSMKSAADFVDWKFSREYGSQTIALDALIASHNDHDHYGGLDDLLDAAQAEDLDAKGVTVEHFFHAGLSWWKDDQGERTLGKPQPDNASPQFFTQLLGDRASAEAATDGASAPQLQGAWGKFISKMVGCRTAVGEPTPITRVSHLTGMLPGFEPAAAGGVSIQVLGPVEWEFAGSPALKRLGGDSISTNGHSVTLRMEYGAARFMLTGDLNKAAHDELLELYEGNESIFACDVAKSCHHGSEDVSLKFLKTMEPAATVISSGDSEGHDHPRPRVVAASGLTGHVSIKDDKLLTPLVYSTEIARSLLLGRVQSIEAVPSPAIEGEGLKKVFANYKVHKPSSLRPKAGRRSMNSSFVVAGLIYGLVNVRTDGKTILCATLNESPDKAEWSVKTFDARFR